MSRDWHAWHAEYDDPDSSLSRRLRVVRDQLTSLLVDHPGIRRVVSMCAGDGRDVLPVLASTAPEVEAVLVELDPHLAGAAESTAASLGLPRVVVRVDDAGSTDAYRGAVPADVVLACGVLGNVSDEDAQRTIATLPTLLRGDGFVIWTRGCAGDSDPSDAVRLMFADAGFDEVAFVRPDDAGFRVGVHRLTGPGAGYVPDLQLFRFV